MSYRILTLEEALNEGKERALPMPVYNDTVVQDRAGYIWMVKRFYDNGMILAIKEE